MGRVRVPGINASWDSFKLCFYFDSSTKIASRKKKKDMFHVFFFIDRV